MIAYLLILAWVCFNAVGVLLAASALARPTWGSGERLLAFLTLLFAWSLANAIILQNIHY